MKEININNEEIREEILYCLRKEIEENIEEITEENVKSLKELNINRVENDDYSFLKYFTNLKKIEIEGCSLTSIEFLTVLPDIENIGLLDNQITDISVLSNFKNLRILDIRYNEVENVEALSKLKNLENLHFRGNKIKSLAPLKCLNLKEICVCEMELSEEDCNIISSFENLEVICGHKSKINGSLKLSKTVKEAIFYNVDTSLIDFSLLEDVNIIQTPKDRILSDFSHLHKVLMLSIKSIDLNEDLELLQQFINEKELQFLHVTDLNFTEYEELSKFRSLKITTDNPGVTSHMLLNNKLLDWYYSSFDKDIIHAIYCKQYIEHFMDYIAEQEDTDFVMHMLYLKKLYLSIYLAYEPDYYNFVPFGKIEYLYNQYITNNMHKMTSYQRARFKEFYAFLMNNRNYETLEEKNRELIKYLEASLDEYKSEFVYYKIIYLYLQIKDYKNAFEWFKKVDNKYDYNYYVGYYELIMMNNFGAKMDLKISSIEYFLQSFKSFSDIEMELIYNFVLLEYLKINSNNITLSYDTVEPTLDKEVINLMVKNKVYEEINTFLNDGSNIEEFYNDLMSRGEIKEVVKRYDEAMEKVSKGKLMIQDIIQFNLIKRGHWEEENPI